MEQVEQGKKLVAAAYKRKVKGFTKGMRVIHQWYGKGVITIVDDRETSLQSYSMDLDVPISLGGGERLNRVWVWPGHLKAEEEERSNKKRITKPKIKEEKTLPNILFVGQPGIGKTTLAKVIVNDILRIYT